MIEKKRILVVDDEQNIRRILQAALDKCGYITEIADSGETAIAALNGGRFDCVLTDVTMPGMNGYELQTMIQDKWPEIPVIIMTAYGTIPQAVNAIRNGAFEYIPKPFDLDTVKKVIKAALKTETVKNTKKSKPGKSGKPFIAESPAMLEVIKTVKQVADSRATILITGESGTGKEVIARLIHSFSPRADESYVAVSCAALPETLLESELFGYVKGAFTGAETDKPGRFEIADKGTLLLDEIGDIPVPTQIKLLRVLQERELERLGSTQPTPIDVRLITATNADLQDYVDAGKFRLDLLYRLKVVEIHLPPLRERAEDIEPLVLHFLAKYCEENGRRLNRITAPALSAMQQYGWPGNVRELENVVERAVVLANRDEEEVLLSHLPNQILQAA